MRTVFFKLTTSVYFLFLSILGGAQHTPAMQNSIKPFVGEATIGEGSGVLNYSLPLFTLESKGISLPISLIYTGDGIKPGTAASWVGEGWELIAGGQISREMNGLPDDAFSLYYPNGGEAIKGYLFTDPLPANPEIYDARDVWT